MTEVQHASDDPPRAVLDQHLEAQVRLGAELERCRRALEDAEHLLAIQKDCFDAIIDHLKLGTYMFDRDGRLVVTNERFRKLIRLGEKENLSGLTAPEFCNALIRQLGALDGGRTRVEAFAALARSDVKGSINLSFQNGQVLQVVHSPIANGGFVQTVEDVTDRRKAEATASHLASHDALDRFA